MRFVAFGRTLRTAIDQLTAPLFTSLNGDDLLFRGRPWRRLKPDTFGRNTAEFLQQVGYGHK
jgi:hypothetical protein